ncbi:MAG TPA: RNA polymerase sigma factor [Phycisphaerae bacterium]|nr:RNA polymerase sigma factor [Phycisphaerae bacterium]
MTAGGNQSDEVLLRKAAAGDAEAFATLAERHTEGLYRLAWSLVGNRTDAEDVLQEAMVGAYKNARTFQGRSAVRTWLGQIVARQAAAFRRSRRIRKTAVLDEQAMESPATGDVESGVDQREDLLQVLKQMSNEYREVIVLRELENMSYEDIATALGLPRGTVESRLFRARAELRELLTEQGYGRGDGK